MIKGLIKFIFILLAAAAVSVYVNQVLWPKFVEQPLLSKFNPQALPLQVVERQQITITENTALEEAVNKIARTVVLIKAISVKGTMSSGTGLILTSDGIIITQNSLLPAGGKFQVIVNNESKDFTIIKRDADLDVALIKISAGDLSTASFYPLENLKIGKRIFLTGLDADGNAFVNQGVVRSLAGDNIQTTIIEKNQANGSAIFSIDGSILGLAQVDKSGFTNIIPISKIKTFAGL